MPICAAGTLPGQGGLNRNILKVEPPWERSKMVVGGVTDMRARGNTKRIGRVRGEKLSGNTTPCKVTPVILHGAVSPAILHGVASPKTRGAGGRPSSEYCIDPT